jgi:NodT family efflux transporter outer membrane factor (OMF) lipoprotein
VAPGTAFTRAEGPVSAAPVPERWWTLFDDPALVALVDEAVVANRDVAVAEANLRRARALLGEARAARFPELGLSAGGGAARPLGGPSGGAIQGTADLAWEVDLFGRVRAGIRAARADAAATEAALDGVRLSVIAATAGAYADACAAARRKAVAEDTLRLARETFALTETRFRVGSVSPLDIARAEAELQTQAAAIPSIEADRQAALLRLAALLGRPPAGVPAEAVACARIPTVGQLIPVGDGAALLGRRPDVRQAARSLEAAAARVGVAAASLLPTVSLGGTASTTASSFGELGAASTTSFSVGPLISWTFPNMAVARSRLRAAEAANEATLASYEATMLEALRETETALSDYARALDRRAALQRARNAAAEAARIVRLRYEVGRENFQVVLDAERTRAGAEAQLAQSEGEVAALQVTLFRALGGGWSAAAGARAAG